MKIVFLNTYYKTGGAASACRRTAEALIRAGVNVTLLTQEENTSQFGRTLRSGWLAEKNALVRLALEKIDLKRYVKKKAGWEFNYSHAYKGLNLSNEPEIKAADLINLHWLNHGLFSLKTLSKLAELRKPIVWTAHDMWLFTGGCFYANTCEAYQKACGNCPFMSKPNLTDLSHQIWKKKQTIYDQLNLTVVTSSQWLKDCASKSSLLSQKKVLAIPTPVDTDNIYYPQDQSRARTALGLPQDTFLLLFGAAKVSDPRKGIKYLHSAIELLKDKLPTQFATVTFGSGDLANFGGQKNYHKGSISDEKILSTLYAACDLFVIPSLADNLPNTVMESLACGTPVLAFASGGIPEMIRHEETGFLVPPENAHALAHFLIEYINFNQEKKMEFRNNARKFALTHYAYSIVAAQYLQLYQSLL